MQERWQYFQERLLAISGWFAVGAATLFVVSTFYLVTQAHWTFFNEPTGDVMVMTFILVTWVLILTLHRVARKMRWNWLYIPLLAITLVFITATSSRLRVIVREDTRWNQMMNQIKPDTSQMDRDYPRELSP